MTQFSGGLWVRIHKVVMLIGLTQIVSYPEERSCPSLYLEDVSVAVSPWPLEAVWHSMGKEA